MKTHGRCQPRWAGHRAVRPQATQQDRGASNICMGWAAAESLLAIQHRLPHKLASRRDSLWAFPRQNSRFQDIVQIAAWRINSRCGALVIQAPLYSFSHLRPLSEISQIPFGVFFIRPSSLTMVLRAHCAELRQRICIFPDLRYS